MKKEYHYTIARTDRICLVSFVILLLGWELIKGLFPGGDKSYAYIQKEKPVNQKKWEKYERKKYAAKSYHKSHDYGYNSKQYDNSFEKKTPPSNPIPIMTASVNELTLMGFNVKTAFNIQKYIASGGVLGSSKDLLRIYGMDSIQLMKASPYIIYAEIDSKKEFGTYTSAENKSAASNIDLNTSTQTELESLNGIGSKLAERVIKFRQSLGGFTSVDQLKDCYGISIEVFNEIKSRLTVSGEIKRIAINSNELANVTHPYLNKKMIKLISAYREQHGPILNEDMLKKVYPADSVWFEKVIPYIDFSDP